MRSPISAPGPDYPEWFNLRRVDRPSLSPRETRRGAHTEIWGSIALRIPRDAPSGSAHLLLFHPPNFNSRHTHETMSAGRSRSNRVDVSGVSADFYYEDNGHKRYFSLSLF